MAKNRTIQLYRGTEAQNDAYTGSIGELTMDTTNNKLRLHDGSTAGGHEIGGSSYHPDLFDAKWADHILNDVSWLRADTFSWQDGSVYQAAYQHLVDDISGKSLQTETVAGTTISFYLADDGHKICPASQESNVTAIYNATGVAWYYIIDTTNQRFKLPRVNPDKEQLLSSAPVLAQASSSTYNSKQVIAHNIAGSVVATGYALSNNGSGFATPTSYNEYADLSNGTGSFSGKKYLYFYVGNFTQTAIENTAGLNTELFNGKADLDLTNVSAAGKATAVGWGSPDYTAGVALSDITPSNPYTATIDCILYGTAYNGTFYVNGNIVAYADGTSYAFPVTIKLSKGDTITTTATKMNRVYMIPLKEAN